VPIVYLNAMIYQYRQNNAVAADCQKSLVCLPKLFSAAEQQRYAANPGIASNLVENQLAFKIDRSSELPHK
jgi:hypothetical protein